MKESYQEYVARVYNSLFKKTIAELKEMVNDENLQPIDRKLAENVISIKEKVSKEND